MLDQSPDSGGQADNGSTVTLYVGVFSAHRRLEQTEDAGQPVRVAVLGGGRSSEHEVSLRVRRVGARRAAEAGPRAGGGAARARRPLAARRASRWRWTPGGGLARRGRRLPGRSTARSARTARCRGCSSCSACPTWGRGWPRPRSRWTSRCSRTCWRRTACPRWSTRWPAHGRPLDLGGLACPVFVKPARLGSSVGISKAWSEAELDAALERAFEHDPVVMVERLVEGTEVECSVLGHRDPIASRPGEIVLRARRRLVRLRGQVRLGRNGADRARPPAGGGARDGAPARARGVRHRGLLGHGPGGLLRGGRPRCWSTS